jgi:N-methylhydantoinase A
VKRVGVDIGGTFTDVVVYDEDLRRLDWGKAPSNPKEPEQGVIAAMAMAGVKPDQLRYLIHGTTIVTNLILERKGAKVGLLVTEGFRDVLEIMRASRPRMYELHWVKPAPVVPRHLRLEVPERVGPDGEVLLPLALDRTEAAIRELLASGVEAIAVCFLHSYVNPVHEQRVRDIAIRIQPGLHVTVSSDVCREIREYERTSTVALNAYAIPRVHRYIEELEGKVSVAGGIRYMTSEGGVIPGAEAKLRPVSLALSGPAGGVLAGQLLGRTLNLDRVITMDMGGTSLDVCVIEANQPALDNTLSVEWGIPIRLPTLQIKTIGAGGGSIVWIDEGGALQIGPESAGAEPGPACYGKGGDRATVTDANMVLGLLNPTNFLGGRFPIDYDRALTVLDPIARNYGIERGGAAEGVYRVANAKMAQAIRQVTVDKGIDPRSFTLISFGGAGGQHAVAVAKEAAIPRVLLPLAPSVLSALGMIVADARSSTSRTLMRPMEDLSMEELVALFRDQEPRIKAVVRGMGTELTLVRTLDLRYRGQSHELLVAWHPSDTIPTLSARFEDVHEQRYGTRLGGAIDVITIRSTAVCSIDPIGLPLAAEGAGELAPVGHRYVQLYREEVPVFLRKLLPAGCTIPTPCIVEESDTSHFLPNGCRAATDRYGNIVVELDARTI